MEESELVEKLWSLAELVQDPGFKEEAFDLWQEIKEHLPAEHRFRLIVAWSKTTDPEDRDQFAQACDQVIKDLQGGAAVP